MNNLLSQSFNFSQLPKVHDSHAGPGLGLGQALPRGAPGQHPGMELSEFNADVASIERQMEMLTKSVQALRALHEESKTAVSVSARKQLHARLQASVGETSRLAKGAKDSIEKLKKSNEKNRSVPGCHQGSPTDRHRSAVSLSLSRTLKAVVEDFSAMRAAMQRHERDLVGRRVAVLTGHELAEAELDRIMQSGRSDEILRQAVAYQGEVDVHAVRDAIAEIEERSAAVADIAKSLQELHQMMVDMSLLVEQQQELLDQVEVHIGAAHEEAKAGVVQLTTAVKTRQNTRKWVCLGVLIVAIILLIILIPIAIQAIPKH